MKNLDSSKQNNVDLKIKDYHNNGMRDYTTEVKYILYARKSSENEDRQMQSIDDQISHMTRFAKERGLHIVDVMFEAKSAKAPNRRLVFSRMIDRINDGEANGILAWQFNRISRNPQESGMIQQMLQDCNILSIQTIDREYRPEDNAMMLSVDSSSANQFILDLQKNVRRGVDRRVKDNGWHPNMVPNGYLNDKEEHIVIDDPDRFHLVRRMWDLMLTGNYTPPQILNIANNEWGYRTKKRKRSGGGPLSRAGIYRIFTNIFYAGINIHHGEYYPGKHHAMITLEEYDRVQVLLGRKGKPRPKSHIFTYSGFIRCGECGFSVCGEIKTKIIKSTGEVKYYIYYHCTGKRRDIKCMQKSTSSISEADLTTLFDQELKKYTILPKFREWALEVLEEYHDKEVEERTKVYQMQQRLLADNQNQLDNLIKMRCKDMITDEQYFMEKTNLTNAITSVKEKLHNLEDRAERWTEITEKVFNFATYARIHFEKGDLQTKKEILMALGSNLFLKDKKIDIKANEWFKPILNDFPDLNVEYQRLEKDKSIDKKAKVEALNDLSLQVREALDGLRTNFRVNLL